MGQRELAGFTRNQSGEGTSADSNHRRQFNNLRSQIILLTRMFSNVQATDINIYIYIYITRNRTIRVRINLLGRAR